MILLLGHMIALSPVFDRFAFRFIAIFKNGAVATAAIAFITLLMAFLNWGLGLLLGRRFGAKNGGICTKT